MTRLTPAAVAALVSAVVLVSTSGASAAPPAPDDRPENAFLTYTEPQDWTARVQVDITAYERSDQYGLEVHDWTFDTLALIFPIMRETASSLGDVEAVKGTLRVGGRDYTSGFKVLDGYPGGAAYGRWDAHELANIREISLVFESGVRSWETHLDENAAAKIGWPEGDWPTEARSTFEPMFGVEYTADSPATTAAIDRVLKKWTDGKDPKSIAPLTLAKYLAGRVVELIQPVGQGLQRGRSRTRRGFEGFRLQGAERTIKSSRGGPFDMAAVLAGVYRRAGLPARIVIGLREFDEYDTTDLQRDDFSGENALHAYVEFFLYDEKTGAKGWIPVDVVQMRKHSSRAGPLDRPWEYFGTHDELDYFIPLSFFFHPPTTVRAYGSPGLWGWFVTPEPPAVAFQQLTFATYNTPVRGGRHRTRSDRPETRP